MIKSLKSSKSLKKAPGFNSLSILKSEDGSRVVTLAQWQDLASIQAYKPPVKDSKSSKDKKEKDKKDLVAIAPTKTLVFQIGKTQAALEGATPAIQGKEAVVDMYSNRTSVSKPKIAIIRAIARLLRERNTAWTI